MPLLFVLFCLCDWLLLTALPHLRLSFPRGLGLPLGASLFVRFLLLGGLLGAALLSRWRGKERPIRAQANSATILFLALNLGFSYIQIDAYVLEPLLVETTELSLASDKLDPDAPPVRVIHLTDTHVERNSYRERDVIRRVNALRPDIIVLTGDYLNISYSSDPTAAAHFRQFVAQLEAPYGIYAVRGSVEWGPASMAWLLEGTLDLATGQSVTRGSALESNRAVLSDLEAAITAEVESAAEEALASRSEMPDGDSTVDGVYGEWPDTSYPGPAPFY